MLQKMFDVNQIEDQKNVWCKPNENLLPKRYLL